MEDTMNYSITNINRKLRDLKLERKSDRKKVALHHFEVASLANLIKDVCTIIICYSFYYAILLFKP